MALRVIPTFVLALILSVNLQGQINAPELLCLKGDTLVWNLPSNSCGPFIGVEVYFSEFRNGPYSLLATINDPLQLEYVHIAGGFPTRFYYLRAQYDCPGMFSPSSDTLENRPPLAPFVNFVSVIDNQVHISWENSLSPQTRKYIIYRATAQGTIPIDTVENVNTYIDLNARPNDRVEFYYILAMDFCETKSPFDQLHNTMLPEVTYDSCSRAASIVWNAYNYWPNGVDRYEIQVEIDGAAALIAGETTADQTNFTFLNLQHQKNYCFTIIAVEDSTGNRARSARRCINPFIITPVDLLCLSGVSTLQAGAVEVFWQVNTDADISYMRLLRSTNRTGPFETVLESDQINSSTNRFLDTQANGGRNIYYYVVETKDQCDVITRSGIGANILLRTSLLPGRVNEISFNAHDLDDSQLLQYELLRITDQGPQTIAFPGFSELQVLDRIEGPSTGNTTFCYQLAARYNTICPQSQSPALSNISCVEQNSSIIAPNAFAPEGINRIFKPVILYAESIQSYQLQVFDRWGTCIFETQNTDQGWDGTYNGRPLPLGTYAFVIRATQNNGKKIEEKGTVTLIR
jgi:gliding motility-associated-like protein